MSENLFNFPGGGAGESGGDPFDLGGFTELTGSDPENPFADLLEEGQTGSKDQPTEDTNTQRTAQTQEETTQPARGSRTAEQEHQPESTETPVFAPQQSKTPSAPQTGDGEGDGDDTPEEDNPLLAAINRQEEKNAKKAAEPIFAQLPVFSYNGTEEPIENIEQTFEELRLAKADDFPEFDEAQNLKWNVTYGKITKAVAIPRKTKIGQFKREIESSKDFLSALKKATDKHPKCLVKPVISMQKKGEASTYKGAFLRLEDARASQKTITFIPGRDGKVYERRTTEAGEFITSAGDTGNITILDDIRPCFQSSLPRIPYALMEQALGLFRTMLHKGKGQRPAEALVHIYWDKLEQRYFIHVPKQLVSRVSVDALLDNEELLDSERYIHYADLHSHNQMPAVFSKQDDHDERATRVYMVAGRLDRYFPEITVRICNGGHFLEIAPEQVLEMPPVARFPAEWLESIHTEPDEVFGVAA